MYKDDKVVRVRPFDSASVQFKSYLSQSISIARNTNNKQVRTILIGHNTFTLDTRILLRKAGNEVSSKLQSMDVWFTDSLSLCSKNSLKVNILLYGTPMEHFRRLMSPLSTRPSLNKLSSHTIP